MDALLNWLVQGALVALAAAAGLALIPRSRPETRAALAWTAYLSLVALPAIAPALALIELAAPGPLAEALATPAAPLLVPDAWWAPAALAGLWIAWAGAHLVAFARAWASVRALRRRATPCSPVLLMRLPHWSRVSAVGRRARVVLSPDIRTAGILGGGSPLIAIPGALIDDLDAAGLDRVLVHEWARVQRRGDLAQWTQRAARAIAGWHPAAWWLERQLDVERDAACKAFAGSVTGESRRYTPSRLPGLACAAALVLFTMAAGHVRLVVETMSRPAVAPAPAAAWAIAPRPIEPYVKPTAARPPIVRAARREAPAPAVAVYATARVPAEAVSEPAIAEVPFEPLGLLPPAPRAEPRIVLAAADADAATDTVPPGISIAPAGKPQADSPAPWMLAADAGVAIGRASKDAGLATAGFFSRLGKRIAGAF